MPDTFTILPTQHLSSIPPSHIHSHSSRRRSSYLSASLHKPLDRVNVLGGDLSGHTGCVNALSWARGGEFLLSGGDDTTVRLWRMDTSDTSREYPFVCDAVIRTGHHGNIFNAQLLPHSARIATVARDGQIRISDVGDCFQQPVHGREQVYTTRQTNLRVLECHEESVKRIVTEDSPDVFLTVSEDGSVRQHDLRTRGCGEHGSCPTPLVQMEHELSTLALSPLTPYQFVVAGGSPYGYLFDRRQSRRHLRVEWGMPLDDKSMTTCVRRFGRADGSRGHGRRYDHITGARMASTSGHEVLLSYSSDAVYWYSTLDEAKEGPAQSQSSILRPNPPPAYERLETSATPGLSISDSLMEEDIERFLNAEHDDGDESGSEELVREDTEDGDESERYYPHVPIVYPRRRFAGACNVDTVKDVNFLGPRDEFVVSGSDDGNFFIWNKATGGLHDILEGDGSVVNVIEGHPYLPLIAVSGIDTTVKLFAPTHDDGPRSFSRMRNAEAILRRNHEAATSPVDFRSLAMYSLLARRIGLDGEGCQNQ